MMRMIVVSGLKFAGEGNESLMLSVVIILESYPLDCDSQEYPSLISSFPQVKTESSSSPALNPPNTAVSSLIHYRRPGMTLCTECSTLSRLEKQV